MPRATAKAVAVIRSAKHEDGSVVRPVSVIHTSYQGASIMLTPTHRLRSTHPLVHQLGTASFVPEQPLDFED